ncbi:hypothetical protein NMG60_11008986 [Bertholletia excelsa]
MRMKSALPFVVMILQQVAQSGQLIAAKEATHSGMTNFPFVTYSSALTSLILLPSSFLIHKSRPPITFSILCQFFALGLIGSLTGYAGVQFTPASYASAMVNLAPGFTFTLAVIFRMEKLDCGSSSTWAKSIGTAVSIAGAFIASLYLGPLLLMGTSTSGSSNHNLLPPETNFILGGSLLALCSILSSSFIIVQVLIVKKYPAELIIIFFYCFFTSILSAAISFVLGEDTSSWSIKPYSRLISVIYSGVFGSGFMVAIGTWCIKRTGPLFVVMFQPLGIVISAVLGTILLGDSLYLGTLLGSAVIVIGFYLVMRGKAEERNVLLHKESNLDSTIEEAPLLQNNV